VIATLALGAVDGRNEDTRLLLSSDLTHVFHLDDKRQWALSWIGIVARNSGHVHWSSPGPHLVLACGGMPATSVPSPVSDNGKIPGNAVAIALPLVW